MWLLFVCCAVYDLRFKLVVRVNWASLLISLNKINRFCCGAGVRCIRFSLLQNLVSKLNWTAHTSVSGSLTLPILNNGCSMFDMNVNAPPNTSCSHSLTQWNHAHTITKNGHRERLNRRAYAWTRREKCVQHSPSSTPTTESMEKHFAASRCLPDTWRDPMLCALFALAAPLCLYSTKRSWFGWLVRLLPAVSLPLLPLREMMYYGYVCVWRCAH